MCLKLRMYVKFATVFSENILAFHTMTWSNVKSGLVHFFMNKKDFIRTKLWLKIRIILMKIISQFES